MLDTASIAIRLGSYAQEAFEGEADSPARDAIAKLDVEIRKMLDIIAEAGFERSEFTELRRRVASDEDVVRLPSCDLAKRTDARLPRLAGQGQDRQGRLREANGATKVRHERALRRLPQSSARALRALRRA